MSKTLYFVKEQAILKVARRTLNEQFQIGKSPEDPTKILVAKLGDMNSDELRKALNKVRGYKNNENGTPNKGKTYWEKRIIFALKIRTEMEEIIKNNPEVQKANTLLDTVEQSISSEIAASIKEEIAEDVE